jgi:hypothetical protein
MIRANGCHEKTFYWAAFTLCFLAIFALAQLVSATGICEQGSTPFESSCLSGLPLFRAPVWLDVAKADPRFPRVVI